MAIETQQTKIDKAEVDKVNADKTADDAIAAVSEKSKAIVAAAEKKAAKALARAKYKAIAANTVTLNKQAKVINTSVAIVKDARANIDEANKWIAQIPSID